MHKTLEKISFQEDGNICLKFLDNFGHSVISTINHKHNNYYGENQRMGLSRAVEAVNTVADQLFGQLNVDFRKEAFKAVILPSYFVAYKTYISINEHLSNYFNCDIKASVRTEKIIYQDEAKGLNNKYNEPLSLFSRSIFNDLIKNQKNMLHETEGQARQFTKEINHNSQQNNLRSHLTRLKNKQKESDQQVINTKALLIGCCIRTHYPIAIVKNYFAGSTKVYHNELIQLQTNNTLGAHSSKNFSCLIRSIDIDVIKTSSQAEVAERLACNVRIFCSQLESTIKSLNIKYIYMCDVKTPETIISAGIAKKENLRLCVLSHSGVPQLLEWIENQSIDSIDSYATNIQYPKESIYIGASKLSGSTEKSLRLKYNHMVYRVNPWILGIVFNGIRNQDLAKVRKNERDKRGFKPKAIITAEYIPNSVVTMSYTHLMQLIDDLASLINHLVQKEVDCCLRFRGDAGLFLPKLLNILKPDQSIDDYSTIINTCRSKNIKIKGERSSIEIGWGAKNGTHLQLQSVASDPFLIMMENSTTAAIDAKYAKLPCFYFYRDRANSFYYVHNKVFGDSILTYNSLSELKSALSIISSKSEAYTSLIR